MLVRAAPLLDRAARFAAPARTGHASTTTMDASSRACGPLWRAAAQPTLPAVVTHAHCASLRGSTRARRAWPCRRAGCGRCQPLARVSRVAMPPPVQAPLARAGRIATATCTGHARLRLLTGRRVLPFALCARPLPHACLYRERLHACCRTCPHRRMRSSFCSKPGVASFYCCPASCEADNA